MDFYTPLFSKIVDSSLWTEPDHVVKMFLTLLALKDQDFVVRYTAFALGKKCWPKELEGGVAELRAIDAIKVLSEPDRSRIEPQPFDGRRIERVEDGYKILNGPYYKELMQKINARAGNAERQKRHREKSKKTTKLKGDYGPPSASFIARETAAVKALERGDESEFDRLTGEGI